MEDLAVDGAIILKWSSKQSKRDWIYVTEDIIHERCKTS